MGFEKEYMESLAINAEIWPSGESAQENHTRALLWHCMRGD